MILKWRRMSSVSSLMGGAAILVTFLFNQTPPACLGTLGRAERSLIKHWLDRDCRTLDIWRFVRNIDISSLFPSVQQISKIKTWIFSLILIHASQCTVHLFPTDWLSRAKPFRNSLLLPDISQTKEYQ